METEGTIIIVEHIIIMMNIDYDNYYTILKRFEKWFHLLQHLMSQVHPEKDTREQRNQKNQKQKKQVKPTCS